MFSSLPIRIGGIKTYDTGEDEVIMEAPVLWGSNAQVREGVRRSSAQASEALAVWLGTQI